MKKVLSIILALVFIVTIAVACASPAPPPPPPPPQPPAQTPVAPPTAPAATDNEAQDEEIDVPPPAPTSIMISASELNEIHGDDNVILIGVISPTAALVPFSNAANPVRYSYLVWVDDYLGLNPEESFYPGDTIYRVPLSQMENLLSRAGVTADSLIVVYSSDWLSQGARVVWHLAMLGLNVRFLDGGVAAWRSIRGATGRSNRLSGQSIQNDFRAPNYDPPSFNASIEVVIEAAQNPNDWVIIDTRTAGQFNGTDREGGAYGTGRIAGSVHVDWEANFDSDGLMLPHDELMALYSFIGDRSVIVYCQGGVRSAYTWIVLRDLGFEVLNFDGSWIHWSWAASDFSDFPSDVILGLTEAWTDNNGKI